MIFSSFIVCLSDTCCCCVKTASSKVTSHHVLPLEGRNHGQEETDAVSWKQKREAIHSRLHIIWMIASGCLSDSQLRPKALF